MASPAHLTPRQAAFVPEFLASGNATASAIKAGFSVKGASVAGTRMLRNASVQKAIQARQAADAIRLSIQREDVLKKLLEAVDMARELRNPMGMVAALKQVALMMGYHAPRPLKLELAPGDRARMDHLKRLSDAELLALIARGDGGAGAH